MDDDKIYTEIFMQADKNKDSLLSYDELFEQMKKFGYKEDELKFKEYFEKSSSRSDKKMQKNEFVEAMKKAPQIMHKAATLRRLFYSLDTNKNGTLEKNEIESALKVLGENVSKEEVNCLMSKFDKNDNQKISFEEFICAYMKMKYKW